MAAGTLSSPFADRLRKNWRHFRKWARARGLEAFRVYDRDMPEYPYAVDWYAGRIQLLEYPRRKTVREGLLEEERSRAIAAVEAVLEVPPERIFVKTHLPKAWGREQYGRLGRDAEPFMVEEQGLKFAVELAGRLDAGLFLDHRNTRARVREEARGARFLNLFSYTGSFTVYAAAGGAVGTTSVDLSSAYLDWTKRNLELNGLWSRSHALVRADAAAWARENAGRRFDLIVVDPPPFSTSQRAKTFDIQQDHPALLRDVLALLAPEGALYFSTNFHGFRLDPRAFEGFASEELTPRSIPEDFHEKNVHRCWRVSAPKTASR